MASPQRYVFLLIALVVLAICGMFVLRERCSESATRKRQYEKIEEGMAENEVVAICGEPAGRKHVNYGWYLWWDYEGEGCVLVMISDEEMRVEYKQIFEPVSIWDRFKKALGLGQDERLGQTFSF
jgi:hypothetical protein